MSLDLLVSKRTLVIFHDFIEDVENPELEDVLKKFTNQF